MAHPGSQQVYYFDVLTFNCVDVGIRRGQRRCKKMIPLSGHRRFMTYCGQSVGGLYLSHVSSPCIAFIYQILNQIANGIIMGRGSCRISLNFGSLITVQRRHYRALS